MSSLTGPSMQGPQVVARNTVVLLSGGMDSAALVEFYRGSGSQVRAIFVDLNQPAVTNEKRAAKKICEHYQVKLAEIKIQGASPKASGLINGRNALLLYLALMEYSGVEPITIAIGVHAGTQYYDCSLDFIKAMQGMADAYTNGLVIVGAPFVTWSKKSIWEFSLARGVPLEMTYSCESSAHRPCGLCLSCRDIKELHDSAINVS